MLHSEELEKIEKNGNGAIRNKKIQTKRTNVVVNIYSAAVAAVVDLACMRFELKNKGKAFVALTYTFTTIDPTRRSLSLVFSLSFSASHRHDSPT